jgi:hypothetical protein
LVLTNGGGCCSLPLCAVVVIICGTGSGSYESVSSVASGWEERRDDTMTERQLPSDALDHDLV